MAASDVFVELIDLLKKPVDLAGDIIREPLKIIDTELKVRESTGEEREKAKLELKKLKADYEHHRKEARENAKLERDINKWEEDVRNLRSKNELARHKELLKAAEEFAERTARTFTDIQNSISTMATEQEQRIVAVQAELIKMFDQLNESEIESVYQQMESGLKKCPNNEAAQNRMVFDPLSKKITQLVNEREKLVDELRESIKRIQDNHVKGTEIALAEAQKTMGALRDGVSPGLQIQNQENPKALEDGSVVETTLANDGAES